MHVANRRHGCRRGTGTGHGLGTGLGALRPRRQVSSPAADGGRSDLAGRTRARCGMRERTDDSRCRPISTRWLGLRRGSVIGHDRACPRAGQARSLTNVSFEIADAQVHPFEPAGYDVAMSRFGSMFFGDPVAAFTNIGRGLRPGGRLVLVSWHARQQRVARGHPARTGRWSRAAIATRRRSRAVRARRARRRLDDPDRRRIRARRVSGRGGALLCGGRPRRRCCVPRSGGVVRGLLQGLDASDRERALDAFRATMASHEGDEGVRFDSAALAHLRGATRS